MQALAKNDSFDFEVEDKKEFLVVTSSSINTRQQLSKLLAFLAEKFQKHKERMQLIRNKEHKII